MKLPIVDGRKCVPVRFLPFMTRSLSADTVAELFSHPAPRRHWKLTAFQLRQGEPPCAYQPSDWDRVVLAICALQSELQAQKGAEIQQWIEWDRRSVELLPAGIFVWRDELIEHHQRRFGGVSYSNALPSRLELEAANGRFRRLLHDPAVGDDAHIDDTHGDDGELGSGEEVGAVEFRRSDWALRFDPPLSAEERRLVFEGFELAQQEPSAPPSDLSGLANPGLPVPKPARSPRRRRRDVLDPVIERVQAKCVNPTDTSEVFAWLASLAQEEHPPLLAAMKAGIKYTKNGADHTLTRDALHKRLNPRSQK